MHRRLVVVLTLLTASTALAGGPPAPISIVVQGDTQDWARLTLEGPKWIATNRAICAAKPAALLGTGDIVSNPARPVQWAAADAAFDVLEACGVPFAAPAGNHDFAYPPGTLDWAPFDAFRARHPPLALAASPTRRSWTQALFPGVIAGILPFAPDAAEVQWLIDDLSHRSARVILLQHEAIEPSAWAFAPAIWQVRAARGGQIIGIIGGHYIPNDRVEFRALPGGGFALFSNWQWTGDPFSGWVTWLDYRGGSWCVSTRNLLTGATGLMEAPSCV